MVFKKYDPRREGGVGKRYNEIDILRGLAVVGMVMYHLLVDLETFYGLQIGVAEYPMVLLARAVGTIFITLLGVGAFIQYKNENSTRGTVRRGGVILMWAGVISIVTYVLFPGEFIYFGILHLLGVSLLLLTILLRIKSSLVLLVIGTVVIGAGRFLNIPIRATLDYYPPVPWFGFVVVGVVAGRKYLVWREKQNFEIKQNWLSKIGRRSLLVYLIHQPILIGLLWTLNKFLNFD